MKRLGRLALVGLLAATVTVWGQQGGGGGGNSGGGGTGGGGNTGGGGGNQGGNDNSGSQVNRGTGQQNDPFGGTQTVQPMPRPVYLSGEVVLSNGEIPPEPATIERVCAGQVTPETYTDMKGRFSFEVGGDPTLSIADASVAGGGGSFGRGGGFAGGGFAGGGLRSDPTGMTVDMSGCDLRASLPGFTSTQVQLGVRRALDNPNIGTIVLTPLAGYGGAFISATSLQAPKKARAAYQKATREMAKKRGSNPEKVAKELEKAVAEYPEYASAWALLGEARLRMDDSSGAREAFQSSLEADPKYMRPYGPLLKLTLAEKDWPAIESLTDAALQISPSWTQARYYLAVAQFSQGHHDDALTTIDAVQKEEDAAQYPQTHQIIGMIHSQRGSFEQAANSFRHYLELQPDSASAPQIRKQLNEWETLGVVAPAEVAAAQ